MGGVKRVGALFEAGFALMTESEDNDGVLIGIVPIERDIAGAAERYHQLAQSGIGPIGPTDGGGAGQLIKAKANGCRRPIHDWRIDLRQKIDAAFKTALRARREDQVWHSSGSGLSPDAHFFSHCCTSSPVTCSPVS